LHILLKWFLEHSFPIINPEFSILLWPTNPWCSHDSGSSWFRNLPTCTRSMLHVGAREDLILKMQWKSKF